MLKSLQLLSLFLLIGVYSLSQGTNQIPSNSATPINSQVPFPGEPCASSYLEDYLLRTDPAYAKLRKSIENQLQAQIALQQSNPSRSAGIVYTIPIVFHIMHSGEAIGDSTNISFAQIQSTIAALNRDFRRTSADGGIASSGPLGADTEIEFCLAQKDPSGNLTTGVTRHDMSGNQNYLDSGVYHTASLWRSDLSMKTLVNWDNTKYMNVWVVNKIRKTTNYFSPLYTRGVQGYAYFPGSSYPQDGVVILSTACGNDPTGALGYNVAPFTNDNRVLTHEIGHYLDLYHTFESTSACAATSGVNCATIGDRCCDTPPTIQGTGNNCTTPVCPFENKENYMQYQNGSCASDFTPDQVARMRAVLASTAWWGRNDLVTNNNCSAPPAIDLELDTIFVPIDTICSSSLTPEIVVCNASATDSVISFDVKYKLDAGVESTFNWVGNLQAGECDTFLLPLISSIVGGHTYTARVDTVNINGSENDIDGSNNIKTNSFSIGSSSSSPNHIVSICDSFFSPSGKVWKTTGVFFDTIPNSFGCDSLMTFNLTISTVYRDTLVQVHCDSPTVWNGVIYWTDTIVNDTVTTGSCDSIFTLDFTNYPNYVVVIPVAVCDSITLPFGLFVTSTGTYIDSFGTVNGCDSIYVYNVQMSFSTSVFQSITVCDSFISPSGKIWKTSGLYEDTTNTITHPCDSIVVFNLTISTSTIINNPITYGCDSVLHKGVWYTSSQSVYDTVGSSSSCDTIFVDSLSILSPTSSINTMTICDSLVTGSGKVFKNSGFFQDTMVNSQGCDSLVDFYLTINKSSIENKLVNSCVSYLSPTGKTYDSSGFYVDTLSRVTGCDSLINIYLVIDTVTRVTIDSVICFEDSVVLSNGTVINTTGTFYDTVFGSIGSSLIYSEDFEGSTHSFTLNSHDTNAITPGGNDNAWIVNNRYAGGTVFTRVVVNTPNQNALVTGNVNSKYLHIHNKTVATLSFGTVLNTNYIDVSLFALGGQNGLNFSKMTNDISTIDKDAVSFEMYYLCKGSYGRLYYSLNSGSTWTRIGGQINNGGNNWSTFSIVDSVFANQATIRFAVGFNNTDGLGITPGFAVDQISINAIGSSSSNCDSITTINLTVLPINDTIILDTICRGQVYTLPSGFPVTVTGVYKDTLVSIAGCDSVITTNLLVNDTTQSFTSVRGCDSVISPSGKIWNTTGSYIDSITNHKGCDSVMYINVIIDTVKITRIDSTICFGDSIVLGPGLTIKTSQVLTDSLTTVTCDSVVIFTITVLPLNDTTIFDTICANQQLVLPSGSIASSSGVYRDTLSSYLSCDSIIVINLVVNDTSSSIQVLTVCDSLISPSGKKWTTTGIYQDTIVNVVGCDSLMTFNLTVSTTTYINSVDTACDSLMWRASTFYTSGIYSDTITTFGCDSIYVLDLVINNSVTVTIPVVSCDSFMLVSGVVVYSSGMYRDTTATSNGCDSVIVTSLTIATQTTSSFTLNNCGVYSSPSGKVFAATGVYMDTVVNTSGCDSIITINLTVLTSTTQTILANGCDTFLLPDGIVVSATGIYRDTLVSGNGCDSIIITNLILGNSSNITQTFSLCAGETVVVGANVYGSTGIYRDTFLTVLGCDSIINTNLTINALTPGVITFTEDRCKDASAVTFTATPIGGKWGGSGIDTITGLFNPATAGLGIHIITYTGPGPCGRTDSASVEVFSLPIINSLITDDECDAGQGEIDVSIVGGTPVFIYSWSTGETTEDLIDLKKGIYTLSIVDANGCTNQETMEVINESNPDCNYNIFIANIFSPDGNGENDILKVQGNGIETVEFIVFNRFGNLIFKTTNQENGWDGSYKGQPVNQGAFVYFVNGTFVDGSKFKDKGTITVIRR